MVFDVTDDFECFLVDQEEVAENSSNVKFTQVQRDELETVLERIATKSCNIPGEYEIASPLLDVISSNGSEEKVKSFLLCVRQAFSAFCSVTTKQKTKRVIQIEQNFFRNAAAERLREAWEGMCKRKFLIEVQVWCCKRCQLCLLSQNKVLFVKNWT